MWDQRFSLVDGFLGLETAKFTGRRGTQYSCIRTPMSLYLYVWAPVDGTVDLLVVACL